MARVGRALDLELDLQSAPNFRMSRVDSLNVFGVAQPRLQGLQAILAVLRCDPGGSPFSQCIWFCTREEPISTFHILSTCEGEKGN